MTTSTPSNSFKIALCQTPVTPDKQVNLQTARDYLRRAGSAAANLAVLPECFNSPYDTACFREYAERLPEPGIMMRDEHDSPSLRMLQEEAVGAGMYVVGGSIPEIDAEGKVFNCSLSVSPEGELLAKHRKAHLFDVDVPGGIKFKESDVLSAGGNATVFEATQLGCTVGVGICYDIRFPELAMVQARDLGARLLVYPGAFNLTTGPGHWELLIRARAVDNQVFVVACSPARKEGEGYVAWGHSMVVDPWGKVLVKAGYEEEMIVAEVEMNKVDGVRKAIPTGFQRRTDIYGSPYLKSG